MRQQALNARADRRANHFIGRGGREQGLEPRHVARLFREPYWPHLRLQDHGHPVVANTRRRPTRNQAVHRPQGVTAETDSSAEGRGFEPSVPCRIDDALETALFASAAPPVPPERPTRFARGTCSSNPFPSAGESDSLSLALRDVCGIGALGARELGLSLLNSTHTTSSCVQPLSGFAGCRRAANP